MQPCGVEESLLLALQNSKPQVIYSVNALHNKEKKAFLWKKMKRNTLECSVDDIRDYFGLYHLVSIFCV